jgi:hypothetical protein
MSYVYVAATILLAVYGQIVVKWQVGDTARVADSASRVTFILSLLADPWIRSGLAAGFAAAVC